MSNLHYSLTALLSTSSFSFPSYRTALLILQPEVNLFFLKITIVVMRKEVSSTCHESENKKNMKIRLGFVVRAKF